MRTAPATFTPAEPPTMIPSCSARSNTAATASASGTWQAKSTSSPWRLPVIRAWPMPSVIELPSAFSSPVV